MSPSRTLHSATALTLFCAAVPPLPWSSEAMTSTTASQTIGPYWHLLEDPSWADLTRFGAEGEKITLTGPILYGAGKPCADACVGIWQADPPASDSFPGFGRSNPDRDGMFRFPT